VLATVAVEVGARLVAEAGVERLAAKGRALGELVVALADAWLAPHGVALASPATRAAAART
jgi:kynureninase